MRRAGSWLGLVAGLGGVAVVVYALAAVAPAPRVVARAEERGIHAGAYFWTEFEYGDLLDAEDGDLLDAEDGDLLDAEDGDLLDAGDGRLLDAGDQAPLPRASPDSLESSL
jgi:hypothetical protein